MEARILLLEDPYDISLYSREIVIGAVNNTKLIIYSVDRATLAETVLGGTVNCDEARRFWVSWTSQTLRIGRGVLDSEELLQYFDTEFRPILAVSVASGSAGEWQFTRGFGECISLWISSLCFQSNFLINLYVAYYAADDGRNNFI